MKQTNARMNEFIRGQAGRGIVQQQAPALANANAGAGTGQRIPAAPHKNMNDFIRQTYYSRRGRL